MSRASSRVPTSSPLSSAQSSEDTFNTATSHTQPQFRPASTLSRELLQHIQVYLEEGLFSQALNFLLSLITSTTANEKKKVSIPPPNYLALISTLTVHPSFTTRANAREKWQQSSLSLRLLWTISKTTGPVNATLGDAYRFRAYDDGFRGRSDSNENDEKWQKKLEVSYAGDESPFNLADDFWAVVGWALNCSCTPGPHADRWNYWRPWLEYMVDALEVDWQLREGTGQSDQSILWQYIQSAGGGNAKARRMLRAILADGGDGALKEFKPIFRSELKGPKKEKQKDPAQRVAVNIEEEIYGDWLQASESSSDEEDPNKVLDTANGRPAKRLRLRNTSSRRRGTPRASKGPLTDHEDSDTSTHDDRSHERGLGDPESINTRLRLLQLLSNASASPALTASAIDRSFPDLHELYTLFVEFIRPLPLYTFQQFVLPSRKGIGLHPDAQIALCEFILQRILDSDSTSNLSTFEPMTWERFAKKHLPYAASKSTMELQAKASLLLESILRHMTRDKHMNLARDDNVAAALDIGIKTREAKAADIRDASRKRVKADEEDFAHQILDESGRRMRFMLQLARR